MANKNGKGPEEKGPRTGRQMGECEDAEPVAGIGRGCRPCGRGRGKGLGRNQNA